MGGIKISLDKLSKESVADIVSLVSNDNSESGIKPENCSAYEFGFPEHLMQSKDDDVKTIGNGIEESSN